MEAETVGSIFIFIVIVNFFLALICAWLATTRRRNAFLGFIVGLFFGILAIPIILLSPGGKKCPYCLERIDKGAKVCPHCQRELLAEKTGEGKTSEKKQQEKAYSEALSLTNILPAILIAGVIIVAVFVWDIFNFWGTKEEIRQLTQQEEQKKAKLIELTTYYETANPLLKTHEEAISTLTKWLYDDGNCLKLPYQKLGYQEIITQFGIKDWLDVLGNNYDKWITITPPDEYKLIHQKHLRSFELIQQSFPIAIRACIEKNSRLMDEAAALSNQAAQLSVEATREFGELHQILLEELKP